MMGDLSNLSLVERVELIEPRVIVKTHVLWARPGNDSNRQRYITMDRTSVSLFYSVGTSWKMDFIVETSL